MEWASGPGVGEESSLRSPAYLITSAGPGEERRWAREWLFFLYFFIFMVGNVLRQDFVDEEEKCEQQHVEQMADIYIVCA